MNMTLVKSLIFTVLAAATITIFYLYLDRPAAEAALTLKNTDWHELAQLLSQGANNFLFQIILSVGFLLGACDSLKNGPTNRSKSILYICTTVTAAMIFGDVLKEVFGRARPPLLFDKGLYGFFPMAGDYLHYSFPSGHTIRIFSSMTALGFVLPRFRIPAMTLAGLIGISRVIALKHFPSDVLFGAFIGITAAMWGWRILYPYGRTEH
ncbi:MAG: phosphatase PAP2 family protein [Pseudodesulfovibrio sp.]|nr:phosphatase PAP2 family protein [Pseudodesulfovibrio sp.]